ncbi:short-chain dehydrogenase/oxidoreductase [Lachnospiraceae bacterium KM106-2]|nr:short-chain dehydrogenase/oxidoreductase [Lachnospiraceae bacterium KM106-2]
MKEFKDKVAVITGAGNGFGAEFAKECARRSMKMVIVDIDEADVNRTLATVKEMGAEATAVVADVSLPEEVQKMVDTAMNTYGRIDLLFNNAGVAIPGNILNVPERDWEWIMHINVFSQVYAMKRVIPIMKAQGTPCHIVNTASVAGVVTADGMPAYHTSKFAAVALSESVYYDLQHDGIDNIGMSVYCPGFVQTDLNNCERHRPDRFKAPEDPYYASAEFKKGQAIAKHVIETGIPIDSVATSVFNAIEDNEFYILTHPQYTPLIGGRVKNMLAGKGPDFKALRG